MSKIRLGIIGCGNMAGSHGHGFKELAGQMEVTATCDVELERAQKAAEGAGAKLAVADYHEMLDYVDAVLIVLPHDLHYEVGMTCLRAGKHVLMEKPMCNTEEECVELIHTAEREGKVLMTAYPVRFWPIVRKLKELIDSKAHGECFQMSIWTEQYTKYPEGHWAHSANRLGGGQFFSHGCHYVDLMLWFLGRPVRGMHLGTNFGTPWMEKEGTSNVVIEFENGALGYHFGTWGARGTRLGWSIHAHCTEGMLEINLADRKLYLHSHINEEKANLDTESRTQVLMEIDNSGKFTHFEIEHFLDCIQTGKRPITDGPTSIQGLRLIWRLYEAERKNTIADLRGLGLEDNWESAEAQVGGNAEDSR
ncbi:Gfo/Idh/MocA family oxidoreductase [Paenibacillus aurantius]|uniref:Gfo/Idh/MocA family oxidoreductase n=1 Tax=Paenibacillus aurantius TaxID=2918900 RepID=A0AA96LB83_9BACL|nr:Gfo/Idh/MocA family oxidoreductase [Paenibacillus aurantius]WNQ10491.1 Gfo/Idh/MocA family oxidoreductase [Paenibacillus aurantius]